MTITTASLFELAQLSEAAYADFWDASGGGVLTDPETVKTRLVNLQPDGSYDFSQPKGSASSFFLRINHAPSPTH